MARAPGTQMIVADDYIHKVSTPMQISAPYFCIHLMYMIPQS